MNAALSEQKKNKNYVEAYISLYNFSESCLHLVEKNRLLKKGLFSCP